jgi:desulfoferrodoxin (superoxide reductase-like protein)
VSSDFGVLPPCLRLELRLREVEFGEGDIVVLHPGADEPHINHVIGLLLQLNEQVIDVADERTPCLRLEFRLGEIEFGEDEAAVPHPGADEPFVHHVAWLLLQLNEQVIDVADERTPSLRLELRLREVEFGEGDLSVHHPKADEHLVRHVIGSIFQRHEQVIDVADERTPCLRLELRLGEIEFGEDEAAVPHPGADESFVHHVAWLLLQLNEKVVEALDMIFFHLKNLFQNGG